MEAPADALKAATAIVAAVAGGELSPGEAGELAKVVESFSRVAEVADLASRIKRLEQMAAKS